MPFAPWCLGNVDYFSSDPYHMFHDFSGSDLVVLETLCQVIKNIATLHFPFPGKLNSLQENWLQTRFLQPNRLSMGLRGKGYFYRYVQVTGGKKGGYSGLFSVLFRKIPPGNNKLWCRSRTLSPCTFYRYLYHLKGFFFPTLWLQ